MPGTRSGTEHDPRHCTSKPSGAPLPALPTPSNVPHVGTHYAHIFPHLEQRQAPPAPKVAAGSTSHPPSHRAVPLLLPRH